MTVLHDDHLPRLDAANYRGLAYVHWTMTIEDRRSGWLTPVFHYRFREYMIHAGFRYALACPIYCLMPDHLHLVWIGILERSDQLRASKYLRRHLRDGLSESGFSLQHQPYDHVLRDDERMESAFVALVEYIARNSERRGLVPPDGFRDYEFMGCLMPGYPELRLWQPDSWLRFWRAYSFLQKRELFGSCEEE